MKSRLSNALRPQAGEEMTRYPVEAFASAGVGQIFVVVSPDNEPAFRKLFGNTVELVQQVRMRGTRDALLQALPFLKGHAGNVLVPSQGCLDPATTRPLDE